MSGESWASESHNKGIPCPQSNVGLWRFHVFGGIDPPCVAHVEKTVRRCPMKVSETFFGGDEEG